MILYRRLQPEDAHKLVELVQLCYGDSYPVSMLYDEKLLKKKLQNKTIISAVAINEKKEFVGHVGMYWDHVKDQTSNTMTGLVREEYQRQGILARLTTNMGDYIQGRTMLGIHTFAITTHTATQRNALERGTYETGFLIQHCPATLSAKGINNESLGDCIPAIAFYTPLTQPPTRDCYVIPNYANLIKKIYQRINYKRVLHYAPIKTTVTIEVKNITQATSIFDQRRNINRLELQTIGNDWESVTQGIRQSAQNCSHEQGWLIDVPLSQPLAIKVAKKLQEEGWCFGCILFERNKGDYLRMQYSKATIHRERLNIAGEFSAYLMNAILDERDNH